MQQSVFRARSVGGQFRGTTVGLASEKRGRLGYTHQLSNMHAPRTVIKFASAEARAYNREISNWSREWPYVYTTTICSTRSGLYFLYLYSVRQDYRRHQAIHVAFYSKYRTAEWRSSSRVRRGATLSLGTDKERRRKEGRTL